jgi:hypothetical protein
MQYNEEYFFIHKHEKKGMKGLNKWNQRMNNVIQYEKEALIFTNN